MTTTNRDDEIDILFGQAHAESVCDSLSLAIKKRPNVIATDGRKKILQINPENEIPVPVDGCMGRDILPRAIRVRATVHW